MTSQSDKSVGRYFNDPESGAEMIRLVDQDRLITKGMGGLFDPQIDLSRARRILDVGCGPGGWALEVALAHPNIEVVGFDISQAMIEYASQRAQVRGVENVQYVVMDARQHPLDFPDNSFDLVNARFVAFLGPSVWQQLVHEYYRITQPGGIIRLTESEWGITNSPSHERLYGMMYRALKAVGQSYSPDGRIYDITPLLGGYLRTIGCRAIEQRPHVIDFSFGTQDYEGFLRDWVSAFRLMKPFLTNTHAARPEEVDQLVDQMEIEMRQESYRGIMFVLTTWGQKPEA